MSRVITRVAIGVMLGITLLQIGTTTIGVQDHSMPIITALYLLAWSIGITYSSGYYLRKLNHLLDPALKISIISWLSIKTGSLGMLVIIIYVMYILIFGWLYGWYLLVRDIKMM